MTDPSRARFSFVRRVAALLALLFVLAPASARASVPEVKKIAMVDLQRVLNETNAGKRARKELENSSTAKQKKLDKLRAKIEKQQSQLGSLNGQKRAAAEEEMQRGMYELQSMYMTLQQDLAVEEGRLLETMYKNCQAIVSKMAREDGLDLVLIKDQTTVLYNQGSLDITATVIKKYNKKHK